jgi:hypothetical protein
MYSSNMISRIVDTLLGGLDMSSSENTHARQFLQQIADTAYSDKLQIVALPIARRLMEFPNWYNKITCDIILNECNKRLKVFHILETLESMVDGFGIDPLCEYYLGVTHELHSKYFCK